MLQNAGVIDIFTLRKVGLSLFKLHNLVKCCDNLL